MNRATSAYVEMAEAISPIPVDQDNLIKAHFKPCYFPQIHCWLICQKGDGKKKKLFNFINCITPLKPASSSSFGLKSESAASILRPCSAFSKNPKSLIYQSFNCTIDFSPTHNQRPSTRRINRNRFSSPGSDEVFKGASSETINNSYLSKKEIVEPQCSSLAQFFVKKLLQSQSAKTHFHIADQYFDLLNELSSWVDRKCNQFPIDDLRYHPTLNPNYERKVNSEADKADHLMRQSGPRLPSDYISQASISTQQWKTPTTAYTSFFDDARNYKAEILTPFLPIERSSPFCKFPYQDEKKAQLPSINTIPNQSLENRQASIRFKNIFQSKTCL